MFSVPVTPSAKPRRRSPGGVVVCRLFLRRASPVVHGAALLRRWTSLRAWARRRLVSDRSSPSCSRRPAHGAGRKTSWIITFFWALLLAHGAPRLHRSNRLNPAGPTPRGVEDSAPATRNTPTPTHQLGYMSRESIVIILCKGKVRNGAGLVVCEDSMKVAGAARSIFSRLRKLSTFKRIPIPGLPTDLPPSDGTRPVAG